MIGVALRAIVPCAAGAAAARGMACDARFDAGDHHLLVVAGRRVSGRLAARARRTAACRAARMRMRPRGTCGTRHGDATSGRSGHARTTASESVPAIHRSSRSAATACGRERGTGRTWQPRPPPLSPRRCSASRPSFCARLLPNVLPGINGKSPVSSAVAAGGVILPSSFVSSRPSSTTDKPCRRQPMWQLGRRLLCLIANAQRMARPAMLLVRNRLHRIARRRRLVARRAIELDQVVFARRIPHIAPAGSNPGRPAASSASHRPRQFPAAGAASD